MLWSEFVEGTGCKDTEKNYKVYKDLEIMYMNSDMSKAEIYEYGKKLVDNSKTEAELKAEAEIKAEIESMKDSIEYHKREAAYRKAMVQLFKEDGDKNMVDMERRMVKYHNGEIKSLRNKIAFMKQVLA